MPRFFGFFFVDYVAKMSLKEINNFLKFTLCFDIIEMRMMKFYNKFSNTCDILNRFNTFIFPTFNIHLDHGGLNS